LFSGFAASFVISPLRLVEWNWAGFLNQSKFISADFFHRSAWQKYLSAPAFTGLQRKWLAPWRRASSRPWSRGFQPGGKNQARNECEGKFVRLRQYQGFFRAAGMPPSTAGETPAATSGRASWRRRNFIPQRFLVRVG
jgi:hypothetical protein